MEKEEVVICYMPRFIIVPLHHLPSPPYEPIYGYPQSPIMIKQQREPALLTKSIWKFPGGYHHLKLNTDGSSKGNPGPSSFGGLIRDSRGRWLCGYMGKMKGRSFTSLEAEVWSVYKGLCLIKDMNLSNLLIETDCQAILMLRAGGMKDDHLLKRVVEAIEAMLMECKCTIIHTKRDGNHCADQLAKLGGKQSEEYTVLEEPPVQLIPYLIRDVEAATYHEFETNHLQGSCILMNQCRLQTSLYPQILMPYNQRIA